MADRDDDNSDVVSDDVGVTFNAPAASETHLKPRYDSVDSSGSEIGVGLRNPWGSFTCDTPRVDDHIHATPEHVLLSLEDEPGVQGKVPSDNYEGEVPDNNVVFVTTPDTTVPLSDDVIDFNASALSDFSNLGNRSTDL